MTPIASLSLPIPSAEPTPHKVEDAARQFESLLIAQLLQSARDSAREGFREGEDGAQSDTILGMAEQQFAQVLARNGGLGLARLVMQGLQHPAPPAKPVPEPHS